MKFKKLTETNALEDDSTMHITTCVLLEDTGWCYMPLLNSNKIKEKITNSATETKVNKIH